MNMRMLPMLVAALLPLLALHSTPALAGTEIIEVMHLPLDEAAAAVQTQLSNDARIAQIPSRRLLMITDDAAHIEQARALLRKLDAAPTQLAVQVALAEHYTSSGMRLSASAALPGGWVQLETGAAARHGDKRRDFMLRTSSGSPGHIEAGEIRAVDSGVRQYLTAHGIVSENDVEMLNVTGGFDVQATLLPGDTVRVNIHPWLRNDAAESGMDAKTEMLIDAGSTLSVGTPPAGDPPIRINALPRVGQAASGQRFMVSEADTEVTLKLGESITLASSGSAAADFSTALLGVNEFNKRNDLIITLTITKAGM